MKEGNDMDWQLLILVVVIIVLGIAAVRLTRENAATQKKILADLQAANRQLEMMLRIMQKRGIDDE